MEILAVTINRGASPLTYVMHRVNQLQKDCIDIIKEYKSPVESTIYRELVNKEGFEGNIGRIHFTLMQLIEHGIVEREEQSKYRYSYYLTDQGESE